MADDAKRNVQTFPRPPVLERTPRHIQIKWNDQVIADTKEAYWVLETHHAPSEHSAKFCDLSLSSLTRVAYYLPPASVNLPLTQTSRSSHCEWKGNATYYSVGNGSTTVADRIWSYDNPTNAFQPIRGYLSFYVGPWDCYVDGEKVEAQPGAFYGGWVTSDIDGIVKGKTGNLDPVV
jgi:uncharacterized protein (DUF427 family)